MEKKNQQISRATYKRIKSMDRIQLSNYITRIYLTGFEAGRKAGTPDVLLRTIREQLLDTEGIGEIRADAIMKKLGAIFSPQTSEAVPEETAGTPTEEAGNTGGDRDTPRRPDYEGDGYADGHLVYDTAYCPECRHSFEEGVNDWGSAFCPDCGQKLDWTPYPVEEEDET